jgi:hypothetical protein
VARNASRLSIACTTAASSRLRRAKSSKGTTARLRRHIAAGRSCGFKGGRTPKHRHVQRRNAITQPAFPPRNRRRREGRQPPYPAAPGSTHAGRPANYRSAVETSNTAWRERPHWRQPAPGELRPYAPVPRDRRSNPAQRPLIRVVARQRSPPAVARVRSGRGTPGAATAAARGQPPAAARDPHRCQPGNQPRPGGGAPQPRCCLTGAATALKRHAARQRVGCNATRFCHRHTWPRPSRPQTGRSHARQKQPRPWLAVSLRTRRAARAQ